MTPVCSALSMDSDSSRRDENSPGSVVDDISLISEISESVARCLYLRFIRPSAIRRSRETHLVLCQPSHSRRETL